MCANLYMNMIVCVCVCVCMFVYVKKSHQHTVRLTFPTYTVLNILSLSSFLIFLREDDLVCERACAYMCVREK